jgi:hypothetical protein
MIRHDGTNDGDGDKDAPKGNTKCHRIDSLTIALIYGREGRSSKSGRRWGPIQHRFLLVLLSKPPDIVSWPGIEPARLTLSNSVISNI